MQPTAEHAENPLVVIDGVQYHTLEASADEPGHMFILNHGKVKMVVMHEGGEVELYSGPLTNKESKQLDRLEQVYQMTDEPAIVDKFQTPPAPTSQDDLAVMLESIPAPPETLPAPEEKRRGW